MQLKSEKETFWGIIAGFFVFWFLIFSVCYLLKDKIFTDFQMGNWINYIGATVGFSLCIMMIILIRKTLHSKHSK